MSNFKRTFGPLNSPVPLSYLDDNFQQLESASTSTVSLAGAALIGFAPSGTGAVSTNLQARGRLVVYVQDFGATGDGTTEDTTAFQNAINAVNTAGGGIVYVPPGTYLSDSLDMKTGVVLIGYGATSILKFKAHNTTSNRFLRFGQGSAINNAAVLWMKIDGNKTAQTGVGDEFSHCVFIVDGSYGCTVEHCVVVNAQGDGIYLGTQGSSAGANANLVQFNEVYDNARQQITVAWGCENRILYNRVTGTIDCELNVGAGELKNNLVFGNTGRQQAAGSETSIRISDLQISFASANTDLTRAGGNIVSNNHCYQIKFDYQNRLLVTNNTVVGSNSTQVFLLDGSGADYVTITGNNLIANASVATSLTHILRTRGNQYFTVTNNNVDNGTLVFHNYTTSFAGSSDALNHWFRGNQLSGSGAYRSGAAQNATEWARFKLVNTNGGSLVLTQLDGVKCSGSVSRSAATAVLSSIGGAGATYRFQFVPYCNATTADATNMTDNCSYTYTASGSNRTVTMFTFAPAAGAVSLSSFSFAAAGGTGTFILDVWF